MKKIFMLGAVVLFVITASLTAFAKDDIKPLSDIGIFEKNVYEEKYVTINELCKITSKLMSSSDLSSQNEQDVYADYVNTFKTNGIIPMDKNGEIYATGEDVCKLYVYALGYYDAAVSTGKSFTSFASNMGILSSSGITYEGEVTYKMLTKMTYKTLTTPLASLKISADGTINTTQSGIKTILSDVYKINVYEGVVNSINKKPYSASVEITRNVYKQNNVIISPGSTVNLKCENSVDLNSVENAPAVFWVIDTNIVSAYLKENTKVEFGVILSVNDNRDINAKYIPANFSEIMLYDDKKEYKVTDNFKVKTDGNISDNTTPVSVIGKYARIVFTDDKISFIETWSFSDSGLITQVEKTTTETIIHYVDKTNSNARFKKLKDYEDIKVIINGKYSDISLLKSYSVFSWCVCNNTLVIAVNEQVISARLNSLSEDYIELGNSNYLRNKTIYFSKNSKKFSDSATGLISMISNDVSAYFDVTNKVVYITPVKNTTVALSSFIGLATGYRYEELEDKRHIEILSLEGTIERKAYIIRKKAVLSDGITFESIQNAITLDNGDAIYEFEINSQNEVVGIRNAHAFEGIGGHSFSLGNFNNNSSIVSFTASDGSDMYVQDTPIVVVYKDFKGNYTAQLETWINMYDKNADGCKAYIYGYEDCSDPKLIVISGKTSNISTFSQRNGVITNKSVIIDENGEAKCKITVLTNQNEQDYYLPLEEGNLLPQRAYISFKSNFRYDHTRTIKIYSFVDLTSSFENWNMTQASFVDTTVKLTGQYTFLTEANKTCFLHPYYCFVAVYENDSIRKGDMSDINPGDRIYYYYTEGSARMIFVCK